MSRAAIRLALRLVLLACTIGGAARLMHADRPRGAAPVTAAGCRAGGR